MTADILIVSPDDHLVEPADLWTSRLPERYRDTGPRIIRHRGRMDPSVTSDVAFVDDEDGRDADIWHYEDSIIPIPLISAAAGYEGLPYDAPVSPNALSMSPKVKAPSPVKSPPVHSTVVTVLSP